jgi:deazaflavin-dependent oxidoreductase (nitroreductase family)
MTEMPPPRPRPKGLMRLLLRMPGLFYRLGLGGLMPNTLLLTTTGRRTGRARATPVNYREEGGVFYVVSGRGTRSDWYRNLVAQPEVEIQIGLRRLKAIAAPVTDPQEKARVLWLWARRSRRRRQRYFGIPRDAPREERQTAPSQPEALALASQQTVVAFRPRE